MSVDVLVKGEKRKENGKGAQYTVIGHGKVLQNQKLLEFYLINQHRIMAPGCAESDQNTYPQRPSFLPQPATTTTTGIIIRSTLR
jgi:hypothetical protein